MEFEWKEHKRITVSRRCHLELTVEEAERLRYLLGLVPNSPEAVMPRIRMVPRLRQLIDSLQVALSSVPPVNKREIET